MPTQGDAMRARRAFDAKNQRDDVDHLNPLIPSIPLMPGNRWSDYPDRIDSTWRAFGLRTPVKNIMQVGASRL